MSEIRRKLARLACAESPEELVDEICHDFEALEAEVAALKPYRDGCDPKVERPKKSAAYIILFRSDQHLISSWYDCEVGQFAYGEPTRWWPRPKETDDEA